MGQAVDWVFVSPSKSAFPNADLLFPLDSVQLGAGRTKKSPVYHGASLLPLIIYHLPFKEEFSELV